MIPGTGAICPGGRLDVTTRLATLYPSMTTGTSRPCRRVGDLDGARVLREVDDQGREVGLERGMGRRAGGNGRAVVEQLPISGGGREPEVLEDVLVRRYHGVQHDGADALGVVAQGLQREVGAVGDPVEAPLVDAEGHAEVGDVGGVLGRVEVRRIPPLGDEPVAAGAGGGTRLLGRRGVEAVQRDPLGEERVDLGAGEQRVRLPGAPLVQEDHVAVGVPAGFDLRYRRQQPAAARSSGEVHERVRRRVRRGRLGPGHGETDRRPVRVAAARRNGQVAALELRPEVERGDSGVDRVRARRRRVGRGRRCGRRARGGGHRGVRRRRSAVPARRATDDQEGDTAVHATARTCRGAPLMVQPFR